MPPFADLHIQPWRAGEWLVATPAGRHVVAGRETLAIVQSLAAAGSHDEAFASYRAAGGRLAREAFLEQAQRCAEALSPLAPPRRGRMMAIRLTLLPPHIVAAAARLIRPLFRWPWLAISVPAALIGPILVMLGVQWAAVVACSVDGMSVTELATGGTIMLGGVLVHELGHAAALLHFGQAPGAIGFGLYGGLLPVFYTDLSRAWRLPPAARAIVSLGGIFTQCAYATAVAAISAIGRSDLLLAAGLSSAALALFQLVPLARADGYWLLADLLGEPNLGRFDRALLTEARRTTASARSARLRLGYQAGEMIGLLSLAVLLIRRLLP